MVLEKTVVEFDWDTGNIDKNRKHNVEDNESEEIFLDEYNRIYKDVFHSEQEERFIVIGKTKRRRLLYVVFTKRSDKIRIISARDINRKEYHLCEKAA